MTHYWLIFLSLPPCALLIKKSQGVLTRHMNGQSYLLVNKGAKSCLICLYHYLFTSVFISVYLSIYLFVRGNKRNRLSVDQNVHET